MIVWATIIVEELHGHWSAWFKNEPAISFGGECPSQVIQRLLDASNPEYYDEMGMFPVEDETRDDHLVFRIPLRWQVVPEFSRN